MRALCLARRLAARRLAARESRRSCEATRRVLPLRDAARGGARGALDDAELGDEGGARRRRAELGLPAMTPKPISRYAGWRMLARWPGEFIQAAMIARGVARSPVPQARFSPIRQAPPLGEVAGGADALRGLGAVAALVGEVASWRPCRCRGRGRRAAAGGRASASVRPRSARSALSRHSVASETAGRLPGVGQHVGVGALVGGADALARRSGRGAGRAGRCGGALESSRSRSASESVTAPPRRPSVMPTLIAPGPRGAARPTGPGGCPGRSRSRRARGSWQPGAQERARSASYPSYRRPRAKLEGRLSRRRRRARPARRAGRGRRTPRRPRDRTACRRRPGSPRRRPRR